MLYQLCVSSALKKKQTREKQPDCLHIQVTKMLSSPQKNVSPVLIGASVTFPAPDVDSGRTDPQNIFQLWLWSSTMILTELVMHREDSISYTLYNLQPVHYIHYSLQPVKKNFLIQKMFVSSQEISLCQMVSLELIQLLFF